MLASTGLKRKVKVGLHQKGWQLIFLQRGSTCRMLWIHENNALGFDVVGNAVCIKPDLIWAISRGNLSWCER